MKNLFCVFQLPAAALPPRFPSQKYLREKKAGIFRLGKETSHLDETGCSNKRAGSLHWKAFCFHDWCLNRLLNHRKANTDRSYEFLFAFTFYWTYTWGTDVPHDLECIVRGTFSSQLSGIWTRLCGLQGSCLRKEVPGPWTADQVCIVSGPRTW